MRLVVGASLLAGAAGAAALTLVVFGGAPEPVITGWALLGFALGWAMLAVLSIRWTDQPQRWALVPAAVSAATGLGLLLVEPGDRALAAAGWVWPPALLALGGWMGLRVRRALAAGSGRWALYAVVAGMAAAAVGGTAGTVASAADQRALVMPGRSYDVGGHRLHLHCAGAGGPTVVLQSGLGETSPYWSRIAPAVAGTTRVCAYDRAGQGWSDDVPRPQDGRQVALDLHTLLRRAAEPGPYVLVGHSTGGTYAMTYAVRYPEEIAGMVLLDGTDPYRSSGSQGRVGARGPASVAVMPTLARLGVGRLVGQLIPPASWSGLPEPAAGQVHAFGTSPRGWRNMRDEYAVLPAVLEQARALTTLGSTPLVVITTTGSPHAVGWAAAHDRMAALSTNSSHRFAAVTHVGLLDGERGATTSTRAILDVVRAVRTRAAVPER